MTDKLMEWSWEEESKFLFTVFSGIINNEVAHRERQVASSSPTEFYKKYMNGIKWRSLDFHGKPMTPYRRELMRKKVQEALMDAAVSKVDKVLGIPTNSDII